MSMIISVIDDLIFGIKIIKLRDEKGITQQQLAKKLGYVINSYISEVEKGTFIPSKKKLRKIAKALRVPFNELDILLLDSKVKALGIREGKVIRGPP